MSEISDLLGGTGTEKPRMLNKPVKENKQTAENKPTSPAPKAEKPYDAWAKKKQQNGKKDSAVKPMIVPIPMETYLRDNYLNVISKIVPLNKTVIDANKDVLDEMHDEDRVLPLEVAMFIALNFDGLVGLLITNKEDFLTTCLNIVAIEADIDEISAEARENMRTTTSPCFFDDCNPNTAIVMQGTIFSTDIIAQITGIAKAASEEFDKTELCKEVKETLPKLDDKTKTDISIVLGAWVYMLRAFTFNGIFTEECTRLLQKYAR